MFGLRSCLLLIFFIRNAFSAPSPNWNNDPMINEGMFQGDIAGIDPDERNMMTSLKKIWTHNTIYYIIDPSLEEAKEKIQEQMNVYMNITDNCIKFVNSKGVGNYLKIFRGSGCWSYFGMNGGEQLLSLGYNCIFSGVILHELGHALGFYHEQCRSDRDEYITILWNNIAPSQFSQFRKLKPYENYLITPYDGTSIMQYGPYVYSKEGKITMVPKDPKMKLEAPHRKKTISKDDLIELKSLYSCPGSTHPAPVKPPNVICTFEKDNCIFTSEKSYSGQFRRVRDRGNYIMLAEGTGDFLLRSSSIFLQQGKACVSMKYQVERDELEINLITVFNDQYDLSKNLQTSKTHGWKTIQFEIDPKDSFEVNINVRSSPTGYAMETFDDFKVIYQPCPK